MAFSFVGAKDRGGGGAQREREEALAAGCRDAGAGLLAGHSWGWSSMQAPMVEVSVKFLEAPL